MLVVKRAAQAGGLRDLEWRIRPAMQYANIDEPLPEDCMSAANKAETRTEQTMEQPAADPACAK